MRPRKAPTAADLVQAVRIALSGIAGEESLSKLKAGLEPLHPARDTFPGEVFLELAADAIEEAGASPEEAIEFEGIRERFLPECTAHTKVQHQHKQDELPRAAAMIPAGLIPGSWTRSSGGRVTTFGSGPTRPVGRRACGRRPHRLHGRGGLRAARGAPWCRSRHAELSTERRSDAHRISSGPAPDPALLSRGRCRRSWPVRADPFSALRLATDDCNDQHRHPSASGAEAGPAKTC